MATTGFGRQETRRKKWIAGLVLAGLAATVVTVAGAYLWTNAHRDKPAPLPQSLPANIEKQASGYSFTRSVEGRQIFTVRAARTVDFKTGGATVLEDVVVDVFGRQGNRHDILRTRQCEYNPRTGDLSSPGVVEIELNAPATEALRAGREKLPALSGGRNPVFLETSQVSFKQQGSLAVTDEPVHFRVGPARGSARGMKYATQEGWIELERDVVLELYPGGAHSGSPAAASGKAAPAGSEAAPSSGPRSPTLDSAPGAIKAGVASAGGAVGQAPIHLTARHLRYDSPRGASGTVALDGPLEITQANRRVLAQRGTIHLDSRNRVTEAVLEDDVRGFDASEGGAMAGKASRVRGEFDPASGQLRHVLAEGGVEGESRHAGASNRLEAQRFEMALRGTHPQPQAGTALGDVRLTLESPPPLGSPPDRSEKKTLAAQEVRFVFRPDGKSLSGMETVGEGQLTLVPTDRNLGQRQITAGRFLMAFDTRSRLESLRGLSNTRMVFEPARNAPPGTSAQKSSARELEASFEPATQALGQVDQMGDFKFQDGDRQATAERARYSASTEVVTLTGNPEVWDPTTRTTAERVLFDLRTDTAEGVDKVQSTQLGTPAGAGSGAQDPTHILADRMRAEQRSQFVHYEGHVRAWQGTDVVESSSLDVSRTQRRMSSGSGVLSSHFQAERATARPGASSAKPADMRPVTVRADRLDYFDSGRKASYHGHVQLQTENTSLRSDRMDVFFSNARTGEASQIERALGDGHVTVTQPTRLATGEHADYDAGPGKIEVTGGPPVLDDKEKGSTTGERLTFFVHDDRLIVDGGDKSPTLSKHRVAP